MFVTPDGGVNPCCFTHQQRYEFGNLLFDELDTIWNNDYYRKSRALYASGAAERAGTLCDSCALFQKPH
jgi:radical SAM protein with 4Fe4S-binding SPASM domain